MIDILIIDNYISQHGQFCLLDWLLAENLIPYSDYEAWRYGQVENLDGCLAVPEADVDTLIQQAHLYCKKLKLVSEPQTFYQWGGNQQVRLLLSSNGGLNDALSVSWVSPQDVPQMDLFMDNSATVVENQVLDCLANRKFDEAQKMLQQLAELNSAHKKLGGYQDLINYGLHISAASNIEPEVLEAEFYGVEQEVAPLAKELLGAKQRDFLAFAWRRIANNFTEGKVVNGARDKFHRSYALLQIPDWEALQSCLEADVELYQSAALMERLTQVYSHTKQTQLFVLMWGLLFERFPEQAEELFALSGTLLLKSWDSFLAFDDDWPERCFLGYLLIQQPGLVHWLDKLPKQAGAGAQNSVNKAVLGLVKARLNEESEKTFREDLKGSCQAMFEYYLNKRDWQASLRALS